MRVTQENKDLYLWLSNPNQTTAKDRNNGEPRKNHIYRIHPFTYTFPNPIKSHWNVEVKVKRNCYGLWFTAMLMAYPSETEALWVNVIL